MKMSRVKWTISAFIIFIIAVLCLFIPYNNERNQQQQIEKDIAGLQQRILLLTLNKNNIQNEITELNIEIADSEELSSQKQAEIASLHNQLDALIEEREAAVEKALSDLNTIKAEYMKEAGSIDCGELLFSLAAANEVVLSSLMMTDEDNVEINGVSYSRSSVAINISGTRDNILEFILQIGNETAFKTAFFDAIHLITPVPLTDKEEQEIYDRTLSESELEEVSRFTIDETVDFIILGISNVTGVSLDVPDAEDMAGNILLALDNLLADEYQLPLAQDLAEIIKQYISEWIVDKIIEPLALNIANAITNGNDQAALAELFGADIAALLGDAIVNLLPSEIAELLKGYIASQIQLEMSLAVFPLIEDRVSDIAAERIRQAEATESELSLVIYSYQEAE